jgi:hypothetical protein
VGGAAGKPVDDFEEPLHQVAAGIVGVLPLSLDHAHAQTFLDRALRVVEAPAPPPGDRDPDLVVSLPRRQRERDRLVGGVGRVRVEVNDCAEGSGRVHDPAGQLA